jgi:PAS domain S-box-containing protein
LLESFFFFLLTLFWGLGGGGGAAAGGGVGGGHAALRAREQQLRNMADTMPALIAYVGRDRRYLFVNRLYETWFRRPVGEMAGKTVDEVLGPEAMQRAGRYIDRALRGEHVAFELEAPYPGGPRWVNAQYLPDVDATGQVRGFCVFVVDVTERKRAEEALRQSEARLRAVLDHLSVGVGLTDQEGRLLLSNATMRTYTPEWIPSRDSARMDRWQAVDADGRPLPPERWPPRRALLGETVRPGVEFRFRGDDGAEVWLLVSAVPLRPATDEAPGAIVVVQDITAHKRANETLQAADRRKDEFIATLAHELRNPLAAIRNAAMVLQTRGATEADGRLMPEVIDRQLQHMSRLLEDLLDVSRLAHDKLTLRKQRLELAEIVRMAIETCRPQLDGAGHELAVALPAAPLWVHADPVRLAQVFANLISNAAKYTRSPGHLRIVAERQGDEVVVSVKDDGVGIPAEMLPHLFELFSQGERASEQVQGGLGVGLALVRGLVHLHGGGVEAKSEGRDRGSEFIVRLPAVDGGAPRSLRPAPLDGGPPMGARLRVLIADDVSDNANTLAMLVRMTGHVAQTAYDGEEALARALELRPEVAILDLGMPKQSGLEVCRRIREQPWGRGMTLIAVTGWGREDDRRLTREAGFDHHLVKPVDPRVLLDLLSSLAVRVSDPIGIADRPSGSE